MNCLVMISQELSYGYQCDCVMTCHIHDVQINVSLQIKSLFGCREYEATQIISA